MKKSEKFKVNSYVVSGFFLAIFILMILSSFRIKLMNDAKKRVEENYQLEAYNISQIYDKNFYAMDKIAGLLAAELLEEDDLFSEECIRDMTLANEAINANNIYVINDSYAAMDANGQTYDNIHENEKLMAVLESKSLISNFTEGKDGRQYIYFIRHIATKEENKGYVVIEYTPDIMSTLLNNPKYSSRKTFALVSSQGNVIEVTGKESHVCEQGANILEKAQDLLYVDGSFNSFRQAIVDCRSGSQQALYGEEGKYIYYTPVDGIKASVVMLVDTADVEKSFAAVSKDIRTLTLELGVAIIAFAGILAAVALFNKARYSIETEDLQNKADTDLLTDLYNKVATERIIKEYLAGEGKNSVSMLFVLDVDDFKKINDTRGHAFGDQVLAQLGHQIRAWFRVNDVLGRIGGDEFMIFIKDVKDPEVIRREGSRIMQFFEGFNVGEYSKYSPTASVGGAVYPTDAEDFESLYKAADKAVYKSKREGKNRVSFYADLNKVEKDQVIDKKGE